MRQTVSLQSTLPNFLSEVHQPKFRILSSALSLTEQEQLLWAGGDNVTLKDPAGKEFVCFLPKEPMLSGPSTSKEVLEQVRWPGSLVLISVAVNDADFSLARLP